MSTETTPTGTTATAPDRSTDLVNRLLKLPEATKIDLANLLLESVRDGFTSLEEAEKRDKELIRSRLEDLTSGKAELIEMDEVFRRIQARLVEVRKK